MVRQYRSGLPGKALEAAVNALPGGDRPADYKDGVVTANRAQYVAPPLAVEGGGNRLGAARYRSQYEHLAHPVNTQKELRKKRVERGPALLDVAIGDRVACAFRGRDSRQSQLAQVSRQGSLGHVPAALQQQLAQIFLTADGSGADYFQDRIVSFAFVGHDRILAPRQLNREAVRESLTQHWCNVMHSLCIKFRSEF